MMQILVSLNPFKLVKNIIANFLYAFSWQFMKSSISWDMFGKIFAMLLTKVVEFPSEYKVCHKVLQCPFVQSIMTMCVHVYSSNTYSA